MRILKNPMEIKKELLAKFDKCRVLFYDRSLINSSFDNFNCFLIEESVPRGRSLGVLGTTVDLFGYFGWVRKA